ARFENLVEAYPAEEEGMPPDRLWPFILHYTRPVAPWLMITSLLVAVLSLIEVVFFGMIGGLIDWLSVADPTNFLQDNLVAMVLGGVALLIGYPLLVLLHSLFLHQTVIGNFPMRVRWLAHLYVLGQSLHFFSDEFAGRVSQKIMQTSLAVRETVLKLLDVGVYVLVYFVGALVLVGWNDVRFTLPLVLWLAGYVLMLWYFVPRLQAISKAQSDARAEMTGRVVDSYTNIQTIKLFAHTQREQVYARDAMDGFMETVYRQMRLVTQLIVALQIMNTALLIGAAGMSIYAWQASLISVGAIATSIGLVLRIRAMSQWIMWEVAHLFEQIGTVQDGVGTIAQPVTITDHPQATELSVPRGEIRFEHAMFHYGRQTEVIRDFSLAIRPGEKIGLVGRSGAGKSTLVNLLLRFYDLEGGRITIDGQDIATVTQTSLRRQIGMVTQDTSLLHRSVRDNIMYGRPEADEEAMETAARLAHADEFIPGLTDSRGREGFDAHVGERGVKLSGGQRQRIAIARIFLKDAPILALDEATSALDSEIEAKIQESLYRLMEGKTVIAIAHRLSTIAAMDRLVVLDQGRIVEIGSHDELLAENGVYAALWRRQSGGFLNVEPKHMNVA
ncbi:MAG: ABC transporter ATP-binding protein, partial [Alphaproteobacteria bacterium]